MNKSRGLLKRHSATEETCRYRAGTGLGKGMKGWSTTRLVEEPSGMREGRARQSTWSNKPTARTRSCEQQSFVQTRRARTCAKGQLDDKWERKLPSSQARKQETSATPRRVEARSSCQREKFGHQPQTKQTHNSGPLCQETRDQVLRCGRRQRRS